jgi:predicted nucleic acid-binding protein
MMRTMVNLFDEYRTRSGQPNNHGFWPDDLRLSAVLGHRFLAGHRQITDAYLVALAVKHRGRFATLDRGVLSVAHPPGAVELLQES